MTDSVAPAPRVFEAREFRHLLTWEVQRCTRYQDFLALCLMRPDYSEAPGPLIHRAVAQRIAELLRSTDAVGIIGEDIAVLLVHTPEAEAAAVAERIRGHVETGTFKVGASPPGVRVALSVGLASFPTDATSDAALLSRAQTRMVDARRAT